MARQCKTDSRQCFPQKKSISEHRRTAHQFRFVPKPCRLYGGTPSPSLLRYGMTTSPFPSPLRFTPCCISWITVPSFCRYHCFLSFPSSNSWISSVSTPRCCRRTWPGKLYKDQGGIITHLVPCFMVEFVQSILAISSYLNIPHIGGYC